MCAKLFSDECAFSTLCGRLVRAFDKVERGWGGWMPTTRFAEIIIPTNRFKAYIYANIVNGSCSLRCYSGDNYIQWRKQSIYCSNTVQAIPCLAPSPIVWEVLRTESYISTDYHCVRWVIIKLENVLELWLSLFLDSTMVLKPSNEMIL